MQQALRLQGGGALAPAGRRVAPCAGRRGAASLRVRAGDGGKVVREFREDSGEVVVPGAKKGEDGAIYVDQVAAAVRRAVHGRCAAA